MNKKIIFLALAIAVLIQGVTAQETEKCVPNYECDEWSDCKDGLKTRACIDTKCDKREIVERSFCENAGCTPEIECDEWSDCIYESKTDNLIKGEVKFGGYKTRVCRDLNKCIPSYIQEEACEDSYQLQLSPIQKCGKTKIAVIDTGREQKIAEIDFDPWIQKGQFNLAFVQGKATYCPSCYNGVQDKDEEEVDCGGTLCKPCGDENNILFYVAIIFLWSGSVVFSFLSFRQYVKLKNQPLMFPEQQ